MEKPLFPSSYMRITQGYGEGTHKDSFAIDNAGKDSSISDIYAPFTSIIKKIYTTDANAVYIWEPNYNTHTTTGISHAREVYGVNITENTANRVPYDGIKAEFSSDLNITFSLANSSQFPNYFGEVVPKIMTVKDNTDYIPLWNLKAGITKLRVYLWLEGQDVDCENNASVGDLSFRLQFSTNPSRNA